MSMQIVDERAPDNNDVIKLMNNMTCGEVCHIEEVGYVMRIGSDTDSIFLILENNNSVYHYTYHSAEIVKVRELYRDESITIKFS